MFDELALADNFVNSTHGDFIYSDLLIPTPNSLYLSSIKYNNSNRVAKNAFYRVLVESKPSVIQKTLNQV